jgi:aspartate/glutamate/glutamine transport system substrate-binding protein
MSFIAALFTVNHRFFILRYAMNLFPKALLNLILLMMFGLFISGCGPETSSKAPSTATPETQGKDRLSVIKDRGKLIAGVKFDSKPFGFLDEKGNVVGYDIDLMREIAKRLLGHEGAVEFKQVLSSTRVFDINSGQVDLVAATMTITPEREEIIDFSDPYFVAGQAVMVPVQSPVQSLGDLAEKKTLFVIGATSEANMKGKQPQTKLVGFKTSLDAFSALKAGRGDAFTTDDTILAGLMQGNCDFRLLKERLSSEPYGLGFKQDPESNTTKTLREKINTILATLKKEGTLDKIQKKWVVSGTVAAGCPTPTSN